MATRPPRVWIQGQCTIGCLHQTGIRQERLTEATSGDFACGAFNKVQCAFRVNGQKVAHQRGAGANGPARTSCFQRCRRCSCQCLGNALVVGDIDCPYQSADRSAC